MTAPAQVSYVRQLWLNGAGIVGMFCERTMTRLARHMGMFARRPQFRLVVVAHDARILARIVNRMGTDQVERSRPEVAIFSEFFGNHGSSHN